MTVRSNHTQRADGPRAGCTRGEPLVTRERRKTSAAAADRDRRSTVSREVGFVGDTLALIASHAGVSAGLVAHYFGDKDGLLEATFRSLAARLSDARARRAAPRTHPAGGVQAVIDANLAPEEFDRRNGPRGSRSGARSCTPIVSSACSASISAGCSPNLRHALRSAVAAEDASSLAAMIAAMIDGRLAARGLSRLEGGRQRAARALAARLRRCQLRDLNGKPTSPVAASGGRRGAPGERIAARSRPDQG